MMIFHSQDGTLPAFSPTVKTYSSIKKKYSSFCLDKELFPNIFARKKEMTKRTEQENNLSGT